MSCPGFCIDLGGVMDKRIPSVMGARGDALEVLVEMETDSVDAVVTDDAVVADRLMTGTAGEHLVCADLLLKGYRAFLADQNCRYDVVVEVGKSLVRVQVKTTNGPRVIPQRKQRIAGYIWHVKRHGKNGGKVYEEGDFDLLALMALDTREIAYVGLPEVAQTFHIRPTTAPGYRQQGECAGCGCDMDDKSVGCASCTSRHWRRERSDAPQGKRFADFPLERALRHVREQLGLEVQA